MIKKIDLGEILDNKATKDYHIICQASMGYTTLGTLSLDFAMRDNLYEFVEQIDRKNEVGSLYPQYYISCFKPPDDSEINKIDFYSNFIKDALMLHKLHVKAKNIAFVFDNYGMPINKDLAEKTLFEVYEKEYHSNYDYEILYAIY